jgi:hypothetical protein
MLRLPDLASEAMTKLAEFAELEKGDGAAWRSEPRIPPVEPAAANGRSAMAARQRSPRRRPR